MAPKPVIDEAAREAMSEKHEWFEVWFNYGGWVECSCGFKPASQEEFDQHEKDGAK